MVKSVKKTMSRYIFLVQTFLLLLLFLPFQVSLHLPAIMKYAGLFFLILGGVFTILSVFSLKKNLTPSPKPREEGTLITSGLYGVVRHPAYSSILLAVLGVSLLLDDSIRLTLTAILLIFFDVKSRIEETWLEKSYPEYTNYKKQVTKKFIPWVY